MATYTGVDPELLKVIAQKAQEKEAIGLPTEPEVSKEYEYLNSQATFTCGANQKLFSELFWKPKTIPDVPVPSYASEYWDVAVRDRIPAVDTTYYLHRPLIEDIVYGMYCTGTLLLHGPTGTGKTTILEQLAARFNMPFMRVSCHGQMEPSEFLGTNQVETDPVSGTPITKHSDTDTTLACKHGGILCIDEIFRSPSTALMSLQATLEYPHKLNLQDAQGIARQISVPINDFKLAVTDNTNGMGDETGNYTAEVQDISTLNRIRRSVYVDYLPKAAEQALLKSVYPGIPKSIFTNMVEVANLVRGAFLKGSVMQTMSIRELLSWCGSVEHLRDIDKAFKYAVLNRLSDTDTKIVIDIYKQVYNRTLRA